MIIQFYQSSDDPKVLDKTMNSIGSGEATLQANVNNTDDTISLLSPAFILASNTTFYTATHIKCASMGNRFYFINNITLLTGGKMLVTCSIDALKTYADKIKLCYGTFIRSEKPRNRLIRDSKYPLTSHMKSKSTLFSSTPFSLGESTTHNYILTVVGGGTSGS